MKHIFRLIILAFLVSTILSSFLKRITKKGKTSSKTKAPLCPSIKLGVKTQDDKDIIINSSDPLATPDNQDNRTKNTRFPPDYQISDAAKKKAEKQTRIARRMFFEPKGIALWVLKKAAAKLASMVSTELTIDTAKDNFIKLILLDSSLNRQVSDTGTLGANRDNSYNLHGVISKVSTNKDASEAMMMDRIGFMGFVGDIGTGLMDSVGPFKEGDPKDQHKKEVFAGIFEKVAKTVYYSDGAKFGKDALLAQRALLAKWGGTPITKERKKPERGTCITSDGKMILIARDKGVLNAYGSGKDDLKLTHPLVWPWQTVPTYLMDNCNDEPFAGHFSGSMVEILWVMDLLTLDYKDTALNEQKLLSPDSWPAQTAPESKLNNSERKAKAALGAAFLLSTGMHTAAEVALTIKAYLGSIPSTIETVCKQGVNSTDYITNLINEVQDIAAPTS